MRCRFPGLLRDGALLWVSIRAWAKVQALHLSGACTASLRMSSASVAGGRLTRDVEFRAYSRTSQPAVCALQQSRPTIIG